MKYLALIGLLTFALACGNTTDEPAPTAEEPAPLVAGPGIITAPDGVAIAYTVSGEGLPALIFIHGWMCNQTFWSAQVEEFSQSNTVITIDLPGHGLSGMDREGWPMMAYGADVQAVVEHFGLDNVVLIGHSMGAPIALETARLMPGQVAAVIAVDALHNAEAKYDPEQKKARLAAFENDFVGTCGQMAASMFSKDSDPDLVEQVTNDMCDGSPELGISLIRQFLDYELGPALAAVADVPVLYINSDKYPTNSEANQKYHPTFSGATVQDVGHFLMMEKPEEFNKLLKQIIENLDQPTV
jgi:pimeloyl-ACP methyl ester carboxylesterase